MYNSYNAYLSDHIDRVAARMFNTKRRHDESSSNNFVKKCKWGDNCKFLKQGGCRFSHDDGNKKQKVVKESAPAPSCPKCSNTMIIRLGDNKFWGCPNFPQCSGTVSISNISCDLCNGSMVERKGDWGPWWGCSNYPSCKHKLTSREKQLKDMESMPMAEIFKCGKLDMLPKSKLEHFLIKEGQSTTGNKDQLRQRIIDIINPPSAEELERRRKIQQEEEDFKQKRKEFKQMLKSLTLKKFQDTCVIPSEHQLKENELKFPHEVDSGWYPQQHDPQRFDCFGCGRVQNCLPTITKDFAVGVNKMALDGYITFYSPKKGQILAELPALYIQDIIAKPHIPIDYFPQQGKQWVEIYEKDGHICIVHREGHWTDSEHDWDVTFYVPRSHGMPTGKTWAFCVEKKMYIEAWKPVLEKIQANVESMQIVQKNIESSVKSLEGMTVEELKKVLRSKNLKLGGRKAELVARLEEYYKNSPIKRVF